VDGDSSVDNGHTPLVSNGTALLHFSRFDFSMDIATDVFIVGGGQRTLARMEHAEGVMPRETLVVQFRTAEYSGAGIFTLVLCLALV
jgi:hypothetical protein